MAKCAECGKGPSFGNAVSFSKRHTRRRFNPNIQTVTVNKGEQVRESQALHALHAYCKQDPLIDGRSAQRSIRTDGPLLLSAATKVVSCVGRIIACRII